MGRRKFERPRMHRPTTESEKILYGARGAHLRFERETAASPPVLFVKLPSDALKAILLDAPISLFGSLVLVDVSESGHGIGIFLICGLPNQPRPWRFIGRLHFARVAF